MKRTLMAAFAALTTVPAFADENNPLLGLTPSEIAQTAVGLGIDTADSRYVEAMESFYGDLPELNEEVAAVGHLLCPSSAASYAVAASALDGLTPVSELAIAWAANGDSTATTEFAIIADTVNGQYGDYAVARRAQAIACVTS